MKEYTPPLHTAIKLLSKCNTHDEEEKVHKLIDKLLEAGAKPDEKDGYGSGMVKAMLSMFCQYDDNKPLYLSNEQEQRLKNLMKKFIKEGVKDFGFDDLNLAVKFRMPEVYQLMLDNCNPDSSDVEGVSGRKKCNQELDEHFTSALEVLLDKNQGEVWLMGMDTEYQPEEYVKIKAMVELITGKAAEYEIKIDGFDLLKRCFSMRYEKALGIIADNFTKLKDKDGEGNTPLHIALEFYMKENNEHFKGVVRKFIEHLIEKRADLDVANNAGISANRLLEEVGFPRART